MHIKNSITLLMVVMIVLISLSGISCSYAVGSGPAITRDFSFTGFNNIQIGSGIEAIISPSADYKISVAVPQSLDQYLDVTQSGQTIRIRLNLNAYSGSHPVATITLPEIHTLDFSGGSSGKILGFKSAHDLSLMASGGSELTLDIECAKTTFDLSGGSLVKGKISFTDATINASGGSRLEIDGKGNNITAIDASGGSRVIIPNISVQDAGVVLSGGSRAEVNVAGNLSVDLSGGSVLVYSGNPQINNISVSGGSTITKK